MGIGTSAPTTAKLVIGGIAAADGLDLSSADQYANLRVIRNSTGVTDKDLYLGYQSGSVSALHLYSNNAETMTLRNNNVGVGNVTPTSSLDVSGAIATKVNYRTSSSGNVALDNSATVWIFSLNIGASVALPDPSTCPNRRYTIANRNNNPLPVTISYYNLSGTSVSNIPAFSSVELISGGASWEQIK